MGGGSWTPADWTTYEDAVIGSKSVADVVHTVLNRKGVRPEYSAQNIKNGYREARDSAEHPVTTPIIIAGDVTGSMSTVAGAILHGQLNTVLTNLYERKVVPGPQVMCMAVDDVRYEPTDALQLTQFESDIRIAKQLQDLYIVHNGGGNGWESYHLPWYVAATMTRTDAWEKRGEKGILITYGDELPPGDPLTRGQIKTLFGVDAERDYAPGDLLAMAQKTWDVYHFVIQHGSYGGDRLLAAWERIMGERARLVTDYTKTGEIIVSLIEVIRKGADPATVAASWKDAGTSLVVAKALDGLSVATKATKPAVVRF
jgi:hypothetical protein